MPKTSEYSKPHEREAQIEYLQKNASFKRLCENLELYQKIFEEVRDDEEKINDIRAKFENIILCFYIDTIAEDKEEEYKNKLLEILESCENGQFQREQLANIFLETFDFNGIKDTLDPQPSKIEGRDGYYNINELVCCEINSESGKKVMQIHINTNNIEGTQALLQKTVDGFLKIKNELMHGNLKDIKDIILQSWLISPAFQEKLLLLFDRNIMNKIVKLDVTNQTTYGSIHDAFLFNKRSLENFLREGKIPDVYKLKLTKDEFLAI